MPRATQTEEYWRDDFDVTPADEIALQEHFIQENRPLEIDELVRLLMEQRLDAEQRGQMASDGTYLPTLHFDVGQTVTFPALGDAVGEVVGERPGKNQRYGEFKVIQVRFNGDQGTREFAAELEDFEWRLPGEANEPQLSLDELITRYGPYVQESTEWALSRSDNFVRLGNRWLPTVMLVDFNEGHRHIADAMIDITGEPMPTGDLLTEIPVDEEASDAVKRFSLDYALGQDDRFHNVGSDEAPHWYLRRLG